MIEVAPPSDLHVENRTLTAPFGPTSGFQAIGDRRTGRRLDRQMEAIRQTLGAKLTDALVQELAASGFEVAVLADVPRQPGQQDTVDYGSLPTRDAVLHVAFSGVGLSSSAWSESYEPKMNASAYLLASPDAPGWLTGGHFYYGADASGDTAWSVPADARHRYPCIVTLADQAGDLTEGYDAATRALARRIAGYLREQL
ncbi:hypothetical protein QTH97_29110 [Variovorax sp. J22R24]|uniref:hypothetical protein n=1 Tax=Variovorax gracilis TaxID=3053502 RepID=UPI0025759E96|nr:hypothetical protein [Variovorax sp. J22R24]MDM0109035.1 hypothetical protein [Variovorax sp. J22R24]